MTGGVNGVALAVFALFFLLVTVADSLAARWHAGPSRPFEV